MGKQEWLGFEEMLLDGSIEGAGGSPVAARPHSPHGAVWVGSPVSLPAAFEVSSSAWAAQELPHSLCKLSPGEEEQKVGW